MRFSSTTLLGLLLVAVTMPAFAAGPAGTELKFASREQYRACLDEEDAAKARLEAFERLTAENNATMFLIQTEAAALVEEQKNLLTASTMQIDAFTKKWETHNRFVKEANERAEKIKAEQDAFNAEMVEHNRKCATLVFRLTDRDAVLKERKAAGKK